MTLFLGDLTILAAAALAVWGLLLFRRGPVTESSALLRTAGVLALLIGIGTGLCAGYYMIKYQSQGHFAHPCPVAAGGQAMGRMQPDMQRGAMGPGAMRSGDMRGMRDGMPMRSDGQATDVEAPPAETDDGEESQ